MAKEKIDLEALILELLAARPEIDIHGVGKAAGLATTSAASRRAVQRAFKALIDLGKIEPNGEARARVYRLHPKQEKPDVPTHVPLSKEPPFQDIPLSTQARAVLRYLGKPIRARAPVGYRQDLLGSYQPGRTFLLSAGKRALLGEMGRAESVVRPAGTYARNILNRLLIDLSWNSSRLEGNTYSLLETQRLLEAGEAVLGKDAAEAQMILNHKGAIEYILESVEDPEISAHTVRSIHALLSSNLLGDPAASGRLRQTAVGVSGTPYLPLDNPHVLHECFASFLRKANRIQDPFEQSFFALVHLSYMQAFEDVNKRTARLVANIPLVRSNLRPLSFTDVPQDAYVKALLGVYEKTDVSLLRDLFIWAYRRSCQRFSAIQESPGGPDPLKLKYRETIQEVVRSIVLEKVEGPAVVPRIQALLAARRLPEPDARRIFQIVETEILSLHDGNIARFRIRPTEFREWKGGK